MRKSHSECIGNLAKLLVFASVLALSQGAALAQVNISGSVSNLRYTVADLNTADGIDATVKLGAWPGLPAASGYIYGWHLGVEEPDFYDSKYMSDNVNAASAVLAWGSSTSVSASFSGREAVSTIRGDLAVTTAPGSPGQNINARADVLPADLFFELAPMSSMTVQLDATLLLAAGYAEGFTQYARGGARLTVGPTWWPGDYDPVEDAISGVAGQYWGTTYPGELSLARTLSVTLVNDSATEWKDGSITFALGGEADITSAVPEAQTWQLLAAGLLVLPAWARRRSARQAAQS